MAKDLAKRLTTPVFRLSHPHFFKAQKALTKGAPDKFSGVAIFEPKTMGEVDKKLWNAILKEVTAQINEVFKLNAPNRLEAQKALVKKYPKAWIALRNGDEGDYADKKGYGAGKMFVRLASESPPGVVDLSGVTIHPSEGNADEIYPGCYCRATIVIKAYAHESGGKGYTFFLGNVQKVKDGERLDSRVAAEDDFNEELDAAWIDESGEDAGEGEAVDPKDDFEGED